MKTSLLARWFVTILMGVALTAGLTGCIGSDDIPTIPGIGGGDEVPAALVGNWTFQSVTLDGQPQDDLNELECVDGAVWANIWFTDRVVRIDPKNGVVTAVGPHGHDHELLGQTGRRGQAALRLRRHLRVLVASAK